MPNVDLEACCRILEVRPGASETDIRRAYKLLVNVWHPDRFQHDEDLRSAAEEKLKAINDAFAALRAARFSCSATSVSRAFVSPREAPRPRTKPAPVVRAPRVPALEKLLAAADRHSSAERFDEEIVTLRQAAGLYPQSFEAWNALAWACNILHGRLHPETPGAYRAQLGRLSMSDEALLAESNRACYEAVRLDPDRCAATQLLESVLSSWAPTAEIRAFCESHAASHPTSARAWENLGYVLYVAEADKAAAASAFRHSLRLDPENTGVWFRLGLCASIGGDWNALEECRESLRRLGHGGQAVILGSTIPFGARVRRWFGGS